MNESRDFSKRHFTEVAWLQAMVLAAVLLVVGGIARAFIRDRYIDSEHRHLADVLAVISRSMPTGASVPADWCRQAGRDLKLWISIIDARNGALLCDTVYPPGLYPGVLEREEIRAALLSADGNGYAIRISPARNTVYGMFTTRLFSERQHILRVGLPSEQFETDLKRFNLWFAVGAVFVIGLVLAVLLVTSRRVLFVRAQEAMRFRELQMQEDLIANVSHEFRTPLTSIAGFADVALSAARRGEVPKTEHLSIIRQDSDRLLHLVNDLLDLSAIDAKTLRLETADVATASVTEEVVERLKMVYGGKRQEVVVQDEVQSVHADAERLIQILLNLIGNAMKYSPEQSRIDVRWIPANGGVELLVEDQGPGIPEPERVRLFQRFSRIQAAGAGQSPGAGLGLAVVKGLVEAHGGSLHHEPLGDRGSRFRARFPSPEEGPGG